MITDHEVEVAIAADHVARARTIVSEQQERVAKLRAKGHSIEMHERTLKTFEATLRSLEDHERLLRGFVAQEDQSR